MKKVLYMVFALGALLMAGCKREEEVPSPDGNPGEVSPAGSLWTITIDAVAEDDIPTKGLAIGDNETEEATTTLKSFWKDWQKVQVYRDDTYLGELDVTPDGSDAHYAKLSGIISVTGLTAGVSRLTLLATERDSWDYSGQTGKLLLSDDEENSIEKKYHYMMAENVLVTKIVEYPSNESIGILYTENATFRNQQSIYRMSFRYQFPSGNKTTIVPLQVTIRSAEGHLIQSQNVSGSSVSEGPITVLVEEDIYNPYFFVALRNGNTTEAEDLLFEVVSRLGTVYLGRKTIPANLKPNGMFVSMKNTTFTTRMGIGLSSEEVDTAL